MPSHRSYRDERDTRDRAPPPLPSLPRRSETIPNPTPPPLAQANMPPYGYYPPPPAAAPIYSLPPTQVEPPAMHKVWILDCKGCGTFLTNRAMRVIRINASSSPSLSPNICFSTGRAFVAPKRSSVLDRRSARELRRIHPERLEILALESCWIFIPLSHDFIEQRSRYYATHL